jgi:excisionase family DNA binding protein
MLEKRLEHYSKEEMLTIQQVARILGCSYGEARNRMLEGRIKSVKDGRWHRTRREWVEEYIEQHAIYTDPSLVQIPLATRRTRKTCGVKPNSIAVQFLLERKK